VLADINVKGAQGVVKKIQGLKLEDTNEESFQALQMDVTKEEDWQNALHVCIEKWGRLDCLVNNAGTTYKNKVCLFNMELKVEDRDFIFGVIYRVGFQQSTQTL
jgi:NADP-dependent 3-hydroxy acid dehydrogenase YdfG